MSLQLKEIQDRMLQQKRRKKIECVLIADIMQLTLSTLPISVFFCGYEVTYIEPTPSKWLRLSAMDRRRAFRLITLILNY